MEFLKNFIGDENTGTRWGGLLSLAAGAGIGAYFGGGILGGVIGLLGGALLAPLVNDAVFSVGRGIGAVKPPGRSTTITPNTPTAALPAPVLQPDGSLRRTNLRAPILENLTPPPPHAAEESFRKRDAIWKILVEGTEGRQTYESIVSEARALERQTDVFITSMEAYNRTRDEYAKPGGERDQLVSAVKSSQTRTGITNPLSDAEIQRFVPTLPGLSAQSRARAEALIAEALPNEVPMFGNLAPFPLAAFARDTYIYPSPESTTPDAARVAEWDKKTPLERLNHALNALDETYHKSDYGKAAINWMAVAGGNETEAKRLRALPPGELHQYATNRLRNAPINTEAERLVRRELAAIQQFTLYSEARTKTIELVKTKMDTVLSGYTRFRNEELVPAAATAQEFSRTRLEVFNQTGIAIFDKGAMPADKLPNASFITIKDCTTPGAAETTLIMQPDGNGGTHITHRIAGGLQPGTDLSAHKLKTPIPAESATAGLQAAPAQLGASLRTLLAQANTTPLEFAMTPDLRRQFELDGTPMTALAFAEVESHSQPTGLPARKREARTGAVQETA